MDCLADARRKLRKSSCVRSMYSAANATHYTQVNSADYSGKPARNSRFLYQESRLGSWSELVCM
jgi:hypothetical protein